MSLQTQSELQSQLAERRRNLRIIEECIQADPEPNEKLMAVRDFLLNRIKVIEEGLASGKAGSRIAEDSVQALA